MQLPELTQSQLEFLSVVHLLEEPATLDFMAELSPIDPAALRDLLKKCIRYGLAQVTADDRIGAVTYLPPGFRLKLDEINDSGRLQSLLDRLEKADLRQAAPPHFIERLESLIKPGVESALLAADRAKDDIAAGRYETAHQNLLLAATGLRSDLGDPENDVLFIQSVLGYSDLCTVVGKYSDKLTDYLEAGREAAVRLGDVRSLALLDFQLGLLFWIAGMFPESLHYLKRGRDLVDKIGDEDMLDQASRFIGMYYAVQGRLSEAVPYLERALMVSNSRRLQGLPGDYFVAGMLGLYCAYIGRFDRSLGCLEYHLRLARREGDVLSASSIRSVLGLALCVMNRKREAAHNLEAACSESLALGNQIARYMAKGGLACLYYLENQFERAREAAAEVLSVSRGSGITPHYMTPLFSELLFVLEQKGLNPTPEFNFSEEMELMLGLPNIFHTGVMLRLKAMKAGYGGQKAKQAEKDLLASQSCLMEVGDPIELAKTRIELARMKLDQNNREEARLLAQQARDALPGSWDELFPEQLKSLLDDIAPKPAGRGAARDYLESFHELLGSLPPSTDLEQFLDLFISSINSFVGAERGGLFWLDQENKQMKLRATQHLNGYDAALPEFGENLNLVMRSYRAGRPMIRKHEKQASPAGAGQTSSMLCLPVRIDQSVRGVLYHDNSHLGDCFKFLDEPLLESLCLHIDLYLNRVFKYHDLLEQTRRTASAVTSPTSNRAQQNFISQDKRVQKILSQVDKAARSDSNILIMGETGVGKEILAGRIHQMSPRRDGPFITVDLTTIPENLVESELFGYEKGAFTGAMARKQGRLEQARQGTLFLDELGECPQSVQKKLLRVLQDKTFVRIGGGRTILTDFRLVSATNRDLAREVEAGRFRQDLYFRLNTIAITMPPLRDRVEDVLPLVRYFLTAYCKKHSRPEFRLTPRDEAMLSEYPWPGNVRELKNVIERAVILSAGINLDLNLPLSPNAAESHPFSDVPTLDEMQRRYIKFVLEKTAGRLGGPGGAAELLGMKRTTLYNRIKKLGLPE